MKPGFLQHVSDSLTKLLNEVLNEGGFNFFKKSELQLRLIGREVIEREGGTLRFDSGDGSAAVLRTPEKVRLHFKVQGLDGAKSLRVEDWDRLTDFFFDNPTVNAFVPESFKALPGLFERLSQEKAILSFQANESGLSFFYTALYHSGQVLDRESLVKQRIIEYRNRERSAP